MLSQSALSSRVLRGIASATNAQPSPRMVRHSRFLHSGQKFENLTRTRVSAAAGYMYETPGKGLKVLTVGRRKRRGRTLSVRDHSRSKVLVAPLPFLAASRATHSAPARRRPRLCTWNHTPDDLLSAGHFSPRPHFEGDSRLIALASEFSAAQGRRDGHRRNWQSSAPMTPANGMCTHSDCRCAGCPRALGPGSPPTRPHANASLKGAHARVRLCRAPSGDLGQAQTRICLVCTSFVHP